MKTKTNVKAGQGTSLGPVVPGGPGGPKLGRTFDSWYQKTWGRQSVSGVAAADPGAEDLELCRLSGCRNALTRAMARQERSGQQGVRPSADEIVLSCTSAFLPG